VSPTASRREPPAIRPYLIAGGAALVLRVGFALRFALTPLGRYLYLDSRLYDQMALAIAAGRPAGGAFFVEPLYAYVLALTYRLAGHQLWLVRGIQVLGGALTAMLACGLAGRLYGRRAALACGLGVALYGPLVFYDAMILKTSFEVLALTGLAFLLVRSASSASIARWLACGLLLGAAVLLRGNFLVLAPLFAFAAWRAGRGSRLGSTEDVRSAAAPRPAGARPRTRAEPALRLAVLAAGLLLAVAPLLAHNRACGGAWVLTTGAGMNFYPGNRPGATGGLEIPAYIQTDPEREEADSVAEASRRASHALSAAQASSFWFRQATRFIAAEPLAWLRLMARKLGMFWSHFEATDDLSFPYTRRVVPFLWIPFLGFWLVGPLGLAGILTLWRRSAEEALLTAAVLLWMVSVALFHVADRYRLAAVPLLVVLGWGFVESLLAAWNARPRSALVVCLGLLAAAIALVNGLDFYPGGQDEAPFDRVMGFGYAEDGRRDLAAEYDRRAAASFSRSAYDSLARGEVYRAESYLRATLEADPAYPGALYHHGLTLERLGRAPEAIAEYERAVAADSDAAEALTHLGRLRLEAGDLDAAERALAEALRRQPERFLALAAFGDLRARQGRFAEARDLYQRALRQQPGARWVSERLARLPP
jgi:hypothetical protein